MGRADLDGSPGGVVAFLYKNKGSMYDGKGFEILAALNHHCHPNSITNAFTTLMSLFNNNMGELKEIMAFHSRFDGVGNNMACCKIVIPPTLMAMFFLCLLHSCYKLWLPSGAISFLLQIPQRHFP
jgi:hypothetical protein